MKTTWSLKTKLISTFVAVGMIPLLVANIISYRVASNEMNEQAKSRVEAVSSGKLYSIKTYFENESKSLRDLSDFPTVAEAMKTFNESYGEYSKLPVTPSIKAKLDQYYRKDFLNAYRAKMPNSDPGIDRIVSSLDASGIQAQYDFIAANNNELGKKHLLNQAERPSGYAKAHSKLHPEFQLYVDRHSLYDLFLVNLKGDVVYSVFKEVDFGTNLLHGSWAQSGLAKAFSTSKSGPTDQVYMQDYSPYTPSYSAPASFLATPIMEGEAMLGVLIIQLPIDKINQVVLNRDGLGETGQTLIVGPDKKLRADMFHDPKTYNVFDSFNDPKLTINEESIDKAMTGFEGTINVLSDTGEPIITRVGPVKILNLTWYASTEIAESEVNAGMKKLEYVLTALILIAAFATVLTAWLTGGSIANRLGAVIRRLDESNSQVSSASVESASAATELSEAATEQAASLQETMASIEEISAMVSQNAESAGKAKGNVEENAKVSNEGKKNVEDMIKAIGEIKSTNNDILAQMESSNKEFSEIVKIISNIGDKTKVINDIVFQTKLLSFNASVEAARAGEHGKGFAVVAEEVGNLAQMSGNAAREISDMLSDSIKKVNDIVAETTTKVDQLVEVGKDKISMGQSIAERCREALERITENARTVSTMISEIANASREQSQGVQEINKAISQLDQVTQQNSAVAQQSSSQAENLNAQAQELSSAVTELVAFVSGGSGEPTHDQHLTHSKDPKVHNTKPQSIRESNVVVMTPKSKSVPKVYSEQERSLMAKVNKQAAGGSTPSSDSPGFEEF